MTPEKKVEEVKKIFNNLTDKELKKSLTTALEKILKEPKESYEALDIRNEHGSELSIILSLMIQQNVKHQAKRKQEEEQEQEEKEEKEKYQSLTHSLSIPAAVERILAIYGNKITSGIRKNKYWQEIINKRCGQLYVMGLKSPQHTKDFYVPISLSSSPNETLDSNDLIKKLGENKNLKIQIYGRSGIGKSSLLRYIGIHCLEQTIPGKQDYIPIYISLRRLDSKNSYLTLFEAIKSTYTQVGVEERNLINTLQNGQAIILIDGLDITDLKQRDIVNNVREFIEIYPNNTFIISTKTEEAIFPSFEPYEIKNFNQGQSKGFIEKWFKQYGQNENLQKCQNSLIQYLKLDKENLDNCENADDDRLAFSQTPLLLSCLCVIYASIPNIDHDKLYKDDLILYHLTIQELIKDWDTDRGFDAEYAYSVLSSQQRVELLAYLAFHFMKVRNFHLGAYLSKDNVKKYILEFIQQPEIKKFLIHHEIATNNEIRAEEILHGLEQQDGLLVSRFQNDYTFVHSQIQSYFVSYYLSKASLVEWAEYVDKYKKEQSIFLEDAIRLRKWATKQMENKLLNLPNIHIYEYKNENLFAHLMCSFILY
ncbi:MULTISPECIES: NACHT domain-containing protein [Calothrix]|uniref:NACHT domain-containing protein n=2 Tax=Calothrix TaxID=1186 RepID=A0ABR8ALE5_9CYAN|nr:MULTISPECIES: NACHT domain-containing protein [Calothrix]MBD2200821.1 NACHT domain-containing protein [Calothrix parietina FACHB-288]MBD2229858.1 NACHT domain-containing protein [Calothrix anomala FACHB-343]